MGQPGSSLVNHLGLTNNWNSPNASLKYWSRYSLLNYYIKNFFKVITSLGVVYNNHLFFSNLFFSTYLQYLSLPVNITRKTFFKFYRIQTLVNSVLNVKKNYIVRVALSKFHISSVLSFVVNEWVLYYYYIFSNYKISSKTLSKSKVFNLFKMQKFFTNTFISYYIIFYRKINSI